jgi:Tol biopolymer transport system component
MCMKARMSGRRVAVLAGLLALAGALTLASRHHGTAASVAQPRPVRIALVYAEPRSRASCDDSGKIVEARADGSDAVTIASGAGPAISPDGRWVAYLAGAGGCIPGRIEIRSLATGLTWSVPRVKPYTGYQGIVWAPNSRTLAAFTDTPDRDRLAIAVVTTAPGATPRVVVRKADGSPFAFSPDGRRIAYTGAVRVKQGYGSDIYTVAANGGAPARLTTGGTSGFPVWGRGSIAYNRDGCRGDVYLMNPDGSRQRRLTHTRAGVTPVAWSAGGGRLLGAYECPNNGKLWAIDPRTGAVHDLTGFVGDLAPLGLSRDGRTVLAGIGCGELTTPFGVVESIPFRGGSPHVLARGPCRATSNA